MSVDMSQSLEPSFALVGVLAKNFLNPKSSTGRKLGKLLSSLVVGQLRLSKDRGLIFLCGANQPNGTPSKRRLDVKKHIESKFPQSSVIFAEGVFREIQNHGKHRNALDIEGIISEIADKIVIVLESESAFCELGAFAHETLRSRLIVINDEQYRSSNSFINVGPIKAIEEEVSPNNVLWYPMEKEGATSGDGIGVVFARLQLLLQPKKKRADTITLSACNPKQRTKESLFFLHDLIYLLGPISNIELSEVLKSLFGANAYDHAKNLIGILSASELIHTAGTPNRIFRSLEKGTFYTFPIDTDGIVATLRAHHLKHDPSRFTA